MKSILAVTVICVLCLATFGWATWNGTVYYFGEKAGKYVPVVSHPADGYTTTQSGSGYSMGNANGLITGKYYSHLKAYKNGYVGKVYVEDEYDPNQSKWGLDINITESIPDPP